MKINFDDHKCELCSYHCFNKRSLGNHLVRKHPEYNVRTYMLEFEFNGVTPLCACGCGKPVNWHMATSKFRKYITGHNDRDTKFSATQQPKLTPEQLQKRKTAIKNTYQTRGYEIKQKISDAVTNAMDSDDMRAQMSSNAFSRWAVPGFKQKMGTIQKDAWERDYDERYTKIFTPEFRKKISDANRNREFQQRSKIEVEIFDILEANLGVEMKPSYWLANDSRNKCYDIHIPDWNLLIELDGIYWHGLDRTQNFSADQVSGLANDFLKNRLAKESGHNLLRIAISREKTEAIKSCKSLQDLISIAHYYQESGSIIKDEMFRFTEDDQALISRDYLITRNEPDLGGSGMDKTREEMLPAVTSFLHEYFSDPTRGWFYPIDPTPMEAVLRDVRSAPPTIDSAGIISGSPTAGNSALKSRMLSYWHADSGPAVSCLSEKTLEKVIAYRMGLNNSKPYTYRLETGETVTTRETFDISPKTIRNGFVVQRKAVSWFPPVVARDIWRHILRDTKNPAPMVWDPSGGFGARMLGFAAAYPTGTYVTTEPASMTYADLQKLSAEIKGTPGFRGEMFMEQCGSECSDFPGECFLDAVFTSPPYFRLEKYFDEPGQCWRDFPTEAQWLNGYLAPTLKNAFLALKHQGRMALNVNAELENAVLTAAKACGFVHLETLRFERKRDHFSRKAGVKVALGEPVLIFERP